MLGVVKKREVLMDTRVVLIAVVLLVLGIARHYIGKWFSAQPV